MADEYYSGTEDEIKRFLLGMEVGNDRISSLTPEEVASAQARIDDVLDDELSTVMYTPVQKILDKNGHEVYPGSVRTIALKRTAVELVETNFGEVQPNVTELVATYKAQADEEIGRIQRREIMLRGQTYKNPNKFIPPEVAPLTPPGAPAAGGV